MAARAGLGQAGAIVPAGAGVALARWGWGWGSGWAGPAAVGVIGGLAAGALIANAYAPPVAYPACVLERQPLYDRFGGFVGYRRVRVCY